MQDYDFRSLSSVDFERIVRDLLQETLGVRLESFKSGRDKGIDLRYSSGGKSADLIVQCKHYAGTPLATLVRHLRNEELPKIARLKPKRYILATSLALSPANKDAIIAALRPWCRSTGDVFGKSEINGLLGRYPAVERQHHKLWLTSTQVLEAITHSDVFNQSQMALRAIQQKIRLYVQTDSFEEAQALLAKHHICVVSGIPGIGKTTLAEMLAIDHLAKGYEAVKISGDVTDALKFFNAERSQVFYYDDFLGQTALEEPKFNKNEDERLLAFLDNVRVSKKHRFILTTREYILNQAKQRYERLDRSNLDLYKCVVDIGKYSKLNRAKILFNHLYFSEHLTEADRNSVLDEHRYRVIIQHQNYSPRIIEWMTSNFSAESAERSFAEELIANLNTPNRVWGHAFERQISEAARQLLIVLCSVPSGGSLAELEKSFDAYRDTLAESKKIYGGASDFYNAMKELDATFVTTKKDGSNIRVFLHNPSINDFLQTYIQGRPSLVRDVLRGAVYFEQVEHLGFMRSLDSLVPDQITRLRQSAEAFCEAAGRTFMTPSCSSAFGFMQMPSAPEDRLDRLLKFDGALQLGPSFTRLERALVASVAKAASRVSKKTLLAMIPHAVRQEDEEVAKALKLNLIERAARGLSDLKDFHFFTKVDEAYSESMSDEMREDVAEQFREFIEGDVQAILDEAGDPDSLSRYSELLETVASRFDVDVSASLEEISERIDDIQEEMQRGEENDYRPSNAGAEEEVTDSEVDGIFDALRDTPKRQ